MENRLYLYNLGIKTFGGFATLGGVIQALQLFTQPDLDIKSILLSFPAWVVYVFVCLTIIFAMLRERYKSMSQRVEVLNVKLNEQDAMIRSLQEMMKIVPFKGRFFLTTEYLYNELGEYIQNNIDIDSIEIKNTIEGISKTELKEIMNILKKSRIVQFAAEGDTYIVSQDAEYKFNQIGRLAISSNMW